MPPADAQLLIIRGKVLVNGTKARNASHIEATRDTLVTVNDEVREFRQFHHVLYHKPFETLTSRRAEIAHRKTVYESLSELPVFREDLRAVGRLDYNTTGVLIFTSDMELLQRMTHPEYHLPKSYECNLVRPCSLSDVASFKIGFRLASKRRPNEVDVTEPAELVTEPGSLKATVTIHEGMHHQVKRMFHAVQNEVVRLKRIAMGPVKLEDSLLPGAARYLTWDEHDALYRAVGLKPPP
jgi:16S rRNA pseudouridine516 synthase